MSTMAAATMVASFTATQASAQQFNPDCVKRSNDTVVLKFYGEPIYASRYAERIKLKKLIKQNIIKI